MPFPPASQALSRFTVLDLTRVRSGPTCVRQLADWGANVIKIEQPPQLTSGEPPGGPREGPDFQNLHRNKRAITLNLKAPEGLAAFRKMVKKADVVVENFRPDVKKRLKIDYKELKKINKKIILGSISGFGQDGPYAGRPGFGAIGEAMGGLRHTDDGWHTDGDGGQRVRDHHRSGRTAAREGPTAVPAHAAWRAGAMGGGSTASFRCHRIFLMTLPCGIAAMIRSVPC